MNKENKKKQFVDALREIVRLELKNSDFGIIKKRRVVIKKVYNSNNHNKRKVDVVFSDDLSQTVALKKIPVNIPYGVQAGDQAELFYFDRPSNGWIGMLITYTAEDYIPTNTLAADSEMLGGLKPEDYVLTSDQRLTNARPASDVKQWAKNPNLKSSDVPNLAISQITNLGTALDDLDTNKLGINQQAANTVKVDGKTVKYCSVTQFGAIQPVSGVHYIVYED